VLTDLRRYRPDHIVPEDAFPGAVFMNEASAKQTLGSVPDDAVAYVNVDDDDLAELRAALRDAAEAAGFDPKRVAGETSVPWINGLLSPDGEDPPLDPDDPDLARGYAVHQLLKTAEFSAQGARYLVGERPFRAMAAEAFDRTQGASERLMGIDQRAWFLETLRASTRTWKVWGNEYSLMQKVIDLTPITIAPAALRQRIVLNADDWDGAPNERDALLEDMADVDNIVVVTGDLHAFFAGTPSAPNQPETTVIELVAGSVSSTPWQASIETAIADDPSLPPEAALIAGLVGNLLLADDTRPNPHIGWLDLEKNGYALVRVEPETLFMTTYAIDDDLVATPASALARPLEELFESTEFRVPSGSRALESVVNGGWKRWDPESMKWV
jgi:alkaline phosphatase D